MHNSPILRLQLVIIGAALAALMLPSFTASFAAQAQVKKTLNYLAPGEPTTIDPQQVSFTDGVAYSNALWRSLLRYDHNNQPEPSIAEEVPTVANGGISTDGKTYTYHIRQ